MGAADQQIARFDAMIRIPAVRIYARYKKIVRYGNMWIYLLFLGLTPFCTGTSWDKIRYRLWKSLTPRARKSDTHSDDFNSNHVVRKSPEDELDAKSHPTTKLITFHTITPLNISAHKSRRSPKYVLRKQSSLESIPESEYEDVDD